MTDTRISIRAGRVIVETEDLTTVFADTPRDEAVQVASLHGMIVALKAKLAIHENGGEFNYAEAYPRAEREITRLNEEITRLTTCDCGSCRTLGLCMGNCDREPERNDDD